MKDYWNTFINELTDGDPYFLQFKNFNIRWYSVLILAGALISLFLLLREAKRTGVDKDFIFNLVFWTIIIGFLGARIYYVIFKFNLYKDDLLSIFRIWEGGLAIHGGIIAGGLTMFVFCKYHHVNFFRITDMAVPCLILAQGLGRWGNFFNGEAHGPAVSLAHLKSLHLPDFIINGMKIGSTYYEPTFLYESLACLIGFVLLLLIRHLKYNKIGTCTSIYLMYYGIVRFIIEGMRTDSLLIGEVKVAQIISIIMFIGGIILFVLTLRKKRFEGLYKQDQIIKND